VVFVLSTVPSFGQFAVAEINGAAVDQTGAALPGATITITEENTGLARTAAANENGRFVIPGVAPGRYTIRAELSGFQTQTRTGVTVLVGQAVTLNFTLPIGTLTDVVTVTGEAPLVEVTQTVVGTNMTSQDIDNLPIIERQQMALLQLVPGLVPNLRAGSFEGTNYSANGRETQSNLYLVDGVHNKDDQSMGFEQVRVPVDSMAEFQVLTHDYGAEYGGVGGVIVNAVTRSGTNQFHGRGFYYGQDESLNGTNHFTKLAGETKPASGRHVLGGNLGGPIFRNKAFFFFNAERTWLEEAVALTFPAEAAPLAVSFSDVYDVNLINYFGRVDYQLTPSHNLSFRMILGPNNGIGENAEDEASTRENFRYERSQETIAGGQWTAVLGDRMLNEVKLSTTYEGIWIADRRLFNEAFNDNPYDIDARVITGLRGVDPLDFGSMQQHPDYRAGPRAGFTGRGYATNVFSEQFTYTPSNHTLKLGFGVNTAGGTLAVAGNVIGTFEFLQNRPFDPANPFTYPSRFQIRLGEIFKDVDDWRTNFFVADKWQATSRLTLNLGVRHDYQHITPRTKDGFQPRIGVAYAVSDRMVIRGGVGKYLEFPSTALVSNLWSNQVIGPAFQFDTREDASALRGVRPAHVCLNPGSDGQGRAVISPACRALLVAQRDAVAAGGFINPEPLLDGDRRLAYLWSFSVGMERELIPNLAVRADYVGNRGRNGTGRIDINEGPVGPNGRVTRLGADVFDPTGVLIPAAARRTNFRRVLQYQTLDAFDSDYNALELSVEKRLANRWAGRASYTLSRSRDVNMFTGTGGGNALIERRVNNDLNPREDYGLANLDNRHAFTAGGNWEPGGGFGIGATFVYYSGNPVSEIVGVDVNGDGDRFDRPVRGRDDATRPIVSKLDANGRAIRNGIEGSNKMQLNLRLQYVVRPSGAQSVGFFWEIYNATDRVNFDNPIGNRRSRFFGQPVVADEPRTMQLGIRYTF
jgi:outer membrane receptor protein involved in Fe transport